MVITEILSNQEQEFSMYTLDDREALVRAILERGMEINPEGVNLKHNEVRPDWPRSPIKLNLCTPDLREKGRMGVHDVELAVRMWYERLKHYKVPVKALGCVPNVGLRLAEMLQAYSATQGEYWPIVPATKLVYPGGRREIGPVTPHPEYSPPGDICLVDDVTNWGFSKREAIARYEQAGYRVTVSLVEVDYDVGMWFYLWRKGIYPHRLLKLKSIVDDGVKLGMISPEIASQEEQYLAASRKLLRPLLEEAA